MERTSRQPSDAGHGHGPYRAHDFRAPQTVGAGDARRGRVRNRLIAACLTLATALPAHAETLRLATYQTELDRDGPGLLLRDIRRGDDQVAAVVAVIAHANPDILLLQGIDYDLHGLALTALAGQLAEVGAVYPYRLALAPNTGVPTGLDLDGNGRRGDPRDAQGYGRFPGQGGMAILSRFPLGEPLDHSAFLWRNLPGSQALGLLSVEALAVQRLASVAAWDVPVNLGGSTLHIWAMHATPPVFDGPEDRNGRRNEDELWFWLHQLDQRRAEGPDPAAMPFVLMGVLNADPVDGEARRGALMAALSHPLLQDPAPTSPGAAEVGDATDTTDWEDPDPGNLRVDYILPWSGLDVAASGVVWPESSDPARAILAGPDGNGASHHRLVWVDLEIGDPDRR